MDARGAVVLGVDLARVQDHPALAVVQVERATGQIVHDKAWHRESPYCERGRCTQPDELTYTVRHLSRLARPGKEAGVRPVLEEVARWLQVLGQRITTPLVVMLDASGGDYRPLAVEVFRSAPEHRLVAVEMTAGSSEKPSHSTTQRWLRVGRTALLSNLELRLERGQIRMPRSSFDTVRSELLQMRRVISESRNLIYQGGTHDDLVVSLALGCWPEPPAPIHHGPSELVWG